MYLKLSIGLLIHLIIFFFFSWSMYSALNTVPNEKRVFPSWFCWMMMIPIAGYVFEWLMIPFGVPHSFTQHFKDRPEIVRRAKTLFSLGLSFVILTLLSFIPLLGLIFFIPGLVIFIIYWVKMVTLKNIAITTL